LSERGCPIIAFSGANIASFADALVAITLHVIVAASTVATQYLWCTFAHSSAWLFTFSLSIPCVIWYFEYRWMCASHSQLTPLDWLDRWTERGPVWHNQVAQCIRSATPLPIEVAGLLATYVDLPSTPQQRLELANFEHSIDECRRRLTQHLDVHARNEMRENLIRCEADLADSKSWPLYRKTILATAINISVVAVAVIIALITFSA
jgi:hypothetical protein